LRDSYLTKEIFEMKPSWTKVIGTALLFAATAAVSVDSMAQDKAPDATLNFSSKSAAIGVGLSWGQGTLHFDGKDYPFRLHGVDVADVGITTVNASGNVYNLHRVSDFGGNYVALSAGAAFTGGGAETAMRNDHGVVLRVRSATEGVQLKAAVEGVTIELEAPAQ
jgi:hypothetical protein